MMISDFKQKHNYNDHTPIIQQYLDVKEKHQNELLLFRMGDFYELFFEDANIASSILGIVLTARNSKEKKTPMCGIPHHSLNMYLNRLIDAGHKIAICEQTESPLEAKNRGGSKAVINREVVKIYTSGTLIDENLLEVKKPNYLMSIMEHKNAYSICYIDVGTGDVYVSAAKSIKDEIEKVKPKEIILPDSLAGHKDLTEYVKILSIQPDVFFSINKTTRIIIEYYNILNIRSIGEVTQGQISALGAGLAYIGITYLEVKLSMPKIISDHNIMYIDAATRNGLELFYGSNGATKTSLLNIINNCKTIMGARMLHYYLSNPSTDIDVINNRYQLIEFLLENGSLVEELRNMLKEMPNSDRAIVNTSGKNGKLSDLLIIKKSLALCYKIKEKILLLNQSSYPILLENIMSKLPSDMALFTELEKAIDDECRLNQEYHPKLAELKFNIDNALSAIEQLKQQYRQETGIETLKISENNVLGIFIEVSNRNAEKVTAEKFIHRQSTVNSARFSTNELYEIEAIIVKNKAILAGLQKEIIENLCKKTLEYYEQIKDFSEAVAILDVITTFAYNANAYKYIQPIITNDNDYEIKEGRHPVVEKCIEHNHFIANNCNLDKEKLWLITGPNMAGKSTFLRQNALIIILAQIGSYVPAEYAKIGIVDKIFSRIGAGDNLAKGESTFMCEMIETSNIMNIATNRSFVILDEVGRGTSTYDGISIAYSCVEYLHNNIGARTLFATHYQELNILEEKLEKVANYYMAIKEENDGILFMHKILKGSAEKSYGLYVAEIAGMPKAVIARAKNILKQIENKKDKLNEISSPKEEEKIQSINKKTEVEKMLLDINLDNTTPKQAMELLYKLKEHI